MAATYLFLNSKEKIIFNEFEDYCAHEFKESSLIEPQKLNAEACMVKQETKDSDIKDSICNPLDNFIPNLDKIKWKKIFNGFYEYSFNISKKEKAKLIKISPGAKIPLHSHNGREFILVLYGKFNDEYGMYSKGDLQINDSKIKHTPNACNKHGCICLAIVEKEIVFYGPLSPILNIITFLKSFFVKKI